MPNCDKNSCSEVFDTFDCLIIVALVLLGLAISILTCLIIAGIIVDPVALIIVLSLGISIGIVGCIFFCIKCGEIMYSSIQCALSKGTKKETDKRAEKKEEKSIQEQRSMTPGRIVITNVPEGGLLNKQSYRQEVKAVISENIVTPEIKDTPGKEVVFFPPYISGEEQNTQFQIVTNIYPDINHEKKLKKSTGINIVNTDDISFSK